MKQNQIFVAIMALLTGLFLVCLFFPPANVLFSSQKSIIFNEGKDWFADFFNVMRYMSDDGGLYYSKINESDGHSGFPLGQVLIYPLTLLVDYSRMSLEDCWMSKPAIFSCVVYLAVLAFFFWDSLNRVCEKYGVKKYNLIIFLFLLLSSLRWREGIIYFYRLHWLIIFWFFMIVEVKGKNGLPW